MNFDESNSPLEQKATHLRKQWFNDLPEPKQNEVIKDVFQKACPTDTDKRKALAPYKD